jgi:hypothetical protein
MKTILAAATVAAAFLLFGAAARADDETVTGGAVTATLSWSGDAFSARGATLTITRNGAVGFSRAIPEIVCDGCGLLGAGSDDVKIADLDGDGENEVVVVAWTGGSGCCTKAGAWDFQPQAGTYRETDLDFVTAGFNLDDLDHDGAPEIVSQDVRFNVWFTNRADELYPPRVLHYLHQDGVPVVVDVTSSAYAAPIRQNAADAKRRFTRLHRRNPNAGGWVASYVADQYLLGHGSTGLRELDRQIKRGILAKAFRSTLLRRLHGWGYR